MFGDKILYIIGFCEIEQLLYKEYDFVYKTI
jgi:hypothetical protein